METVRDIKKQRNTLLLIFAVTFAVHGGFILRTMAKHSWEPSIFISMDERYFSLYQPLFKSRIAIVNGGYDAMFYYMVASDLLEHRTFEKTYFYRRITLPAMMYAVTLGRQEYFPVAFIAISFCATLAAAALMGMYLPRHGAPGMWALGFSLFPGTIISTQFVGTDCLALAFMLGGLLLTGDGGETRPRRVAAGLVCVLLAMLSKEPDALMAGLLALWVFKNRGLRAAGPYALPIAGFALWAYVVEVVFFPGGDYQTWEALRYNYSKGLFGGFFDLFYKAYTGHIVFMSKAFFEDLVAPIAFLGFCIVTATAALPRVLRHGSIFLPAAIFLAATIPFARYPLVNLYSCLRVQMPAVICFLMLAAGLRPRARAAVMCGFAAAVLAAGVFLFVAPAQSFFVFPGL